MELEILYEDNHIIAVNKPGGILVQSDSTQDRILPDFIKDYIKVKYEKPGNVFLGVTHRIDRPVSGVVLFGRTSKATIRMNDAFRLKQVEKIYFAIVEQAPPRESGTLKGYLSKNQALNKSFLRKSDDGKGGKYSELSYRWIGSSDHYHLLEVKPVTGRHHQIRVMLSDMGCVIKGDLKYGARRSNPDGNICLHARSIRFMHPVKNEAVFIEAALPESDIWEVFSGIS